MSNVAAQGRCEKLYEAIMDSGGAVTDYVMSEKLNWEISSVRSTASQLANQEKLYVVKVSDSWVLFIEDIPVEIPSSFLKKQEESEESSLVLQEESPQKLSKAPKDDRSWIKVPSYLVFSLAPELLATFLRIKYYDSLSGKGCTASLKTIGAGLVSERQVRRHIRELEKLGLIKTFHRKINYWNSHTNLIYCQDINDKYYTQYCSEKLYNAIIEELRVSDNKIATHHGTTDKRMCEVLSWELKVVRSTATKLSKSNKIQIIKNSNNDTWVFFLKEDE